MDKTLVQQAWAQIDRARAYLVLDQPFWGILALQTPYVATDEIPTLSTNGQRILYNPDFVKSLSPKQTKSAIAHEVSHIAFQHIWRRGTRKPDKWNSGCDYAINAHLKKAHFELGQGWLYDSLYEDMSEEEIYSKLPDEDGGGGSSSKFGFDGKPCGGIGEPTDDDGNPLTPQAAEQLASEWRSRVVQAATIAKLQGKLPGSISEMIDNILYPIVPWRDKLWRFVDESTPTRYTWTQPNRRHIQRGFYLPALKDKELRCLVICVDTSGSMSAPQLAQAAGEINDILYTMPLGVCYVVYIDARVQRVVEYSRNDLPISLEAVGRGGTDFRPAFDWVEENDINPTCLIYLTDLYGTFPEDPGYPVLWGAINTSKMDVPFGECIEIK